MCSAFYLFGGDGPREVLNIYRSIDGAGTFFIAEKPDHKIN